MAVPGQSAAHGRQAARPFNAPGHALTGDRTQRSRRAGWEYVHSIVDDCSRLAYSELHDDERAVTVTAFTRRALDFFLEHGDRGRTTDDRQRLRLHAQPLAARAAAPARDPPHPHPALHAPHQRQSRALPTDAATRMGLRPPIRLKRRPPPRHCHTGCDHYNERAPPPGCAVLSRRRAAHAARLGPPAPQQDGSCALRGRTDPRRYAR